MDFLAKIKNIFFPKTSEYVDDVNVERVGYGIYKIYIRNPKKYINGTNLNHPNIKIKYMYIRELTKNYIIVDLNMYGGVIEYKGKKYKF